jgi:hypothetical protein
VTDHAGPDHVQIYIDETLDQVLIRGDCGSEIAVLPKSAPTGFAAIVFLSNPASDEVHAL